MRKIPVIQVMASFLLVSLMGVLSLASAYSVLHTIHFSDTFLFTVLTVGFWYIYGLGTYALRRRWLPLRTGEILPGSKNEFIYHVLHLPFLFFWLYPVAHSKILLLPLTRLFYKVFGARIGENSYPGGCTLFDPCFIQVGDNVIMGHHSNIIPHIIESGKLAHYPIQIGNNVTLGVNSVILAGVIIEDNAIVAAGAVVPKFTRIGAGEIWGGLPAHRIDRPTSSDHPVSHKSKQTRELISKE